MESHAADDAATGPLFFICLKRHVDLGPRVCVTVASFDFHRRHVPSECGGATERGRGQINHVVHADLHTTRYGFAVCGEKNARCRRMFR